MNGDLFQWLTLAGAGLLSPVMVYFAWRALFRDRANGRRRCPKCWFDMSYTPGVRCGECGFSAQDEKQLRRTRRRYGLAVLAILACVGVAVGLNFRMGDRGMLSLVPTKALILSLPFTMDIDGELYGELEMRMRSQEFSPAEWRMLFGRCAKGDGAREPFNDEWIASYGRVIRDWRPVLGQDPELDAVLLAIDAHVTGSTRETWPVDVTPTIEIVAQDWWPTGIQTRITATPRLENAPSTRFYKDNDYNRRPPFQLRLTGLANGASEVVIDFTVERNADADDPQWEDAGGFAMTVPIMREGMLADTFTPVDDEVLDLAMQEVFTGNVTRWSEGRSRLRFNVNSRATRTDSAEDVAIGAIVELLYDGQLARRLDLWWLASDPQSEWDIVFEDEPLLMQATNDDSEWEMRVVGDPEVALRAGEAAYYWAGEFTVPMQLRRGRRTEAPSPPWWRDLVEPAIASETVEGGESGADQQHADS